MIKPGREWSVEAASKPVPALQGAMKLPLLNEAEPNAALKNIFPTLDQLVAFLGGRRSDGAQWTTLPVFGVEGFTFSIAAGAVATFNGAPITYNAYTKTVSAPATGLQRRDVFYALPDGSYGYAKGVEKQNPALPVYPVEALFVTELLVNSTSAETPPSPAYVTETQVRELLGAYLPLQNPEGNEVALDANGGYFRFGEGILEFFKEMGGGSTLLGTGYNSGNWTPAGASSLLVDTIQSFLAVSRNGNGATITAFVAADGTTGVRLTARQNGTDGHYLDFMSDGKLYLNGAEFTGGTSGGITQAQLDAAIAAVRPTGFTTFAATNTFNANKIMKLGGTGDTFNANHVLNNAASGNLMDTFLTVLVTGNGTNTVSVDSTWKNANGGAFDATNGKKNEIIMRYIDANNKFYTITQPQ